MKTYIIKIKDKAALIGAACATFEVQWNKNPSADIVCDFGEGHIEVQVPDEGECFSGFAVCYDKDGCETTWIPIEVCPCTNNDQCSNCSYCGPDGECIGTCDKICVNETCIECDENNPCEGGQECKNFKCQCPAATPVIHPVTKKCVECLPGTIKDCMICNLDGEYIPLECDGVCDPNAEDPENPCVGCLKSGDCEDPNAICVDKECQCKPGWIKDDDGICVVAPDCEIDDDCGDCEFCNSIRKCQELIVNNGRECSDCDTADDCDDGYGCDGEKCILCSSLDCDYECGQVQGCACLDADVCEDVGDRCSPSQVKWIENCTGGSPGVTVGGLSPLIGVTNVASLGILVGATTAGTPHSFLRDHQFTYTVSEAFGSTGATSGTWYYSPQYGVEKVIGAGLTNAGKTLTIKLSDTPINKNSSGFLIIYKSVDGREVRFQSTFNQPAINTTAGFIGDGGALQAADQWTSKVLKSTGAGGSTTGATPLVCEFCLSNSDFEILDYNPITYSNETIPGNLNKLQVSFSPGSNNRCVKLNYTGCGQWEGALKVSCLSNVVEVPFEPIFVDEACCILNEGCNTLGDGCDEVETIDISDYIVAYPYYGGDNGYSVQILTSENSGTSPVSFLDMWRLGGAVNQCWTRNNALSNSEGIQGTNANDEASDIYLETTIPSSSVGAGIEVEFCFGNDCDARIDACTKIAGCRSISPCDTDDVILTLVEDFNGFLAGDIIDERVLSGVQIGSTVRIQAMYSIPAAASPWNYEWEATGGITLSNKELITISYNGSNFYVSHIDAKINQTAGVQEVLVTVTNTECGDQPGTIDPNGSTDI